MPFFSPPADRLDPHLFDDSENLHYEVRARLWRTLHTALTGYMLHEVNRWLRAWLAGSGITYQWEGNTDLDVLFGVDYAELCRYNPQYKGLSEAQFAEELDDWLRTNVWPQTSATDFLGQKYEVTFFLNPGTGTDIRNIHPYAALDLRSGEWVVRPPEVAPDPETMYPSRWFDAVNADANATHQLKDRYRNMTGLVGRGPAAAQRNTEVRLHEVVSQAGALLEEIHGGRREAFGMQGTGYGDFHNFRWQSAKRTGTIEVLHSIVQAGKQAREAQDTELYGSPILGSSEALARAALVNRTRTQR